MKLFSLSPTHPSSDKVLLRLFLRIYTEVKGYLLSKCFKNVVLGVKKRWSANAFSDTKQKHVYCKIFSKFRKLFWLCCQSTLFSMSSGLRFIKWVRFFEQNCIVKWVIFFSSFCWLWDFLLKNLKLKKQLRWCLLERVDEYKKVSCPKKYFQKNIFKYEI